MRFSCLSLFPEIIEFSSTRSVCGRALEKGLFELMLYHIRDFAVNDYGKVDDALYGGGTGMLMMAEPIWQAAQRARADFQALHPSGREKVIYLSPRGRVLSQNLGRELLAYDHLILLCGHYEGVDQRVLDALQAEEISIGDYVLTGGELGAAVLIDVMARMIPGVLPGSEAWEQDSHAHGLLEGGQYTRPAEWQGRAVPEVLLSGHAANIEAFREREALKETLRRRPDLLAEYGLPAEKWEALLAEMEKELINS